jgi:hypothetical protein
MPAEFSPFKTISVEPIYNGTKYFCDKVTLQYEGQHIGGLSIETLYKEMVGLGAGCIVSSISVPSNKGYGIVPYSATFECFKFKTIAQNVFDIKNECSMSLQEDGSIQVSRNIEAKSLSLDGSSIGVPSSIVNILKSSVPVLTTPAENISLNYQNLALINEKQSEDKINGIYSINQQYIGQLDKSTNTMFSKPIRKTNWSIQSGIDGVATISVSAQLMTGDLKISSPITIESISNYFPANFIPAAPFQCINFNYKTSQLNRSLDLQAVYSNDERIDTSDGGIHDHSVSVSTDFLSKTCQIQCQHTSKPFISNSIKKLNITDETNALLSLVKAPTDKLYLESQMDSASYSSTLNDSMIVKKYISSARITGTAGKLEFINKNVNINVDFGLPQASITPVLSGKGAYYIEDLDFETRTRVQASVQLEGIDSKTPDVGIFTKILKGLLSDLSASDNIMLKDSASIQKNDAGKIGLCTYETEQSVLTSQFSSSFKVL